MKVILNIFLNNHIGRPVEIDDILDTFSRLPPYYDPALQIFAGLWQNGQPVAVLELLPHLDEKNCLYFSEIIVHGDFQKQGLAAKITKAVILAACAQGFNKIRLGVEVDAVPFWDKMGFMHEYTTDDNIHVFSMKLEELN